MAVIHTKHKRKANCRRSYLSLGPACPATSSGSNEPMPESDEWAGTVEEDVAATVIDEEQEFVSGSLL